MNLKFPQFITLITTIVLIVVIPHMVKSAAMQSGSYKIESDSLNFGGGRSASGSFANESTIGEIATGLSSSTNYKLSAGFQQYESSILAISAISDVVMSPAIGGITGGDSNGSTGFTVTTDNASGYTLYIKASSSPALQSSDSSIEDYGAGAANPDFDFVVASNESKFAFTVEGNDIANSFKDNGAACNAGTNDSADKCWAGFSTSGDIILNRTSANYPLGTASVLKFKVESGAAHMQTAGTYVATTTVTLLPL